MIEPYDSTITRFRHHDRKIPRFDRGSYTPFPPILHPGIRKACTLGYKRRTQLLTTHPGESPRTLSRKCTGLIQCRPALHHTEPRRSANRARWLPVDFVSKYRNASEQTPIATTERGSFSECTLFFWSNRNQQLCEQSNGVYMTM